MTDTILEFKAKITTHEDGTRFVQIPAMGAGHVFHGDRSDITDPGIRGRLELLGLSQGYRSIDNPALEHVSGNFIGTFRVNIRTFKHLRAARAAKAAITESFYATPFEERAERLMDMEERAHAAVLEAFGYGA